MKAIIDLNYATTQNRGLIDHTTTSAEFIDKIKEELNELEKAVLGEDGDVNHELADIILVCLNMSRHYGIDIEQQLIKNISKNINR